jgi:hypothetical protein
LLKVPRLTPRLVRRVLLPIAYGAFFGSLVVSGTIFYRGKPFDAKNAIISDLQSPDDNPHGYGTAAAGTAASAILLVPAASMFFQQLRKRRPKLAAAGAVMFALGLGAGISIGLLAPYTRGYTPVHIQLSFAAFIGICGGTFLHLAAARTAPFLIGLQGVVLLFLAYLYFGPEVFNNDHLLTSLAFWEWILCVDCGVGLWALAGAVERQSGRTEWT